MPTRPLIRRSFFFSGIVVMTILPPIPTTGLTSDDVDKLISKTKTKMTTAFDKADEELEDLGICTTEYD